MLLSFTASQMPLGVIFSDICQDMKLWNHLMLRRKMFLLKVSCVPLSIGVFRAGQCVLYCSTIPGMKMLVHLCLKHAQEVSGNAVCGSRRCCEGQESL